MTCSQCRAKIPLSHQPGKFLAISLGFAAGAVATPFLISSPLNWITSGTSGLIALIAMGGVSTEMTDASASVFSRFKRQGVECEKCGHICKIRPWSW